MLAPLGFFTAQAAVKVGSYVGTWKANISYSAGDLITFNDKTFLSLVSKNKNKNPNINPKLWQLIGGAGSIGSQGISGSKGPNGLTGANGGHPVYILGDVGPSGAGSIVFYVNGTGKHGLEAKTTDAPELLDWADAQSYATSYNIPACATSNLLTPTCWHLPTRTELKLLIEQKKIVGLVFRGVWQSYWSSSVFPNLDNRPRAWSHGYDSMYDVDRRNILGVRAVRAF